MATGMKERLKDQRTEILSLADKYGVREVKLFGSVARGEDTQESDVDLLVEFRSPPTLVQYIGFQDEISRLLGRNVDILTPTSLHWFIRDKVLQEAEPI